MYGLGTGPREKISDARSRSTIGATGRNCSRPLMSFSRSTLSDRSGWASRERWPKARGPYSARPWNQATTPLPAITAAAAMAMSAGRSYRTRAVIKIRSISSSLQPRPSAAVVIGAISSPASAASVNAASRALVQPAAQIQEHLLQHRLNTAGEVRVPFIEIGARLAGRREAGPIHGLGTEPAVTGRVDQTTKNSDVSRCAVRGQRHDLVLVARTLEAKMRSEILVEQSQRMR